MAESVARFRERKTAPEPLGKVILGTLRKKNLSNHAVVSTEIISDTPGSFPSEIERTWDHLNPGPPYLKGDTFLNLKVALPHFDVQGQRIQQSKPGNWIPHYYEYDGGFGSPQFIGDAITISKYLDIGRSSPPDPVLYPVASASCAEVFKTLRPPISKGGLGVALAEARDLPRMLRTSAGGFHDIWKSFGGSSTSTIMQPKKAAGHFLNHQFGWAPFVGDVVKFHDNVVNSERYIDDIKRQNNTWIKRIRTIRRTESERLIASQNNLAVTPQGFIINSMCTPRVVGGFNTYGNWSVKERISTVIWATGSFKYYRPEFDESLSGYNSAWSTMQRHLKLHGATINPSVLYKATPWTWLIDWFSNVGNIVDNVTTMGLDSMVSKYVYLMHHYIREVVFTQTIYFWDGERTMVWKRSSESKQRLKADNPFDFCLSWSDLTPKQLAILAAVGISRG